MSELFRPTIRATRSRILQSPQDAYEFVEFNPTSPVGLPTDISVNDASEFTILGALTIRGVSANVAFDATVTLEAHDRMKASAATLIQRETFELVIPSVPFVASVCDDVLPTIQFVAAAVDA